MLASGEGWLVLLETLQAQTYITIPAREMVMLDGHLKTVATYDSIEGWTLIDAAVHSSGDVSAVYLRFNYEDPYLVRFRLSRHRPDGSRVDTEVTPVAPSDPSSALLIATFDRARLVSSGEAVYLTTRWAGNAVYAYRFGFGAEGFEQEWATRVEPESALQWLGIIGGGFDNFHQGDNSFFAYLDVDGAGNAYVAVPSTQNVLEDHDAAFGENLMAGADPGNFDFGTAILTKVDAQGRRVYARLLGTPGRSKSLLNLRAADDSVFLVGRVKTGSEPDSWDAWILSAEAETGVVHFESGVDVQRGDMFWDVAPLPGQQTIAVGSTNYTQNPSGLSVSDERDVLAVLLDSEGRVMRRLDLPRGTVGRGNEAISVRLDGSCLLAIAGMLDGPGTHAEIRPNGFLDLYGLGRLAWIPTLARALNTTGAWGLGRTVNRRSPNTPW